MHTFDGKHIVWQKPDKEFRSVLLAKCVCSWDLGFDNMTLGQHTQQAQTKSPGQKLLLAYADCDWVSV